MKAKEVDKVETAALEVLDKVATGKILHDKAGIQLDAAKELLYWVQNKRREDLPF